MTGEGFALLAALGYGLAGVTIIKGKATAQGDNGVFLSVVLTAAVSGLMWLGWGQVAAVSLASFNAAEPIAIFIAAGLFSMVLGRTTMYRATEQIGPVAASLLRRLTPVFALPLGAIFLAEVPDALTLVGAALVIAAVIIHIGKPGRSLAETMPLGWLLGIGSAAFYAVSYVLRSHGLGQLTDPALGTFIGAIAGMIWMLAASGAGADRVSRLRGLVVDRGPWHWLTASALSLGQISQFFALKSASVVVVATIGALEVFFAAVLGSLLLGGQGVRAGRVWLPAAIAVFGTGLLLR